MRIILFFIICSIFLSCASLQRANYLDSCNNGIAEACFNLGVLFAKENKAKDSWTYFIKACRLGDGQACKIWEQQNMLEASHFKYKQLNYRRFPSAIDRDH